MARKSKQFNELRALRQTTRKKTSIGKRNLATSTMNKHKRRRLGL
jgi:hypothetical protein